MLTRWGTSATQPSPLKRNEKRKEHGCDTWSNAFNMARKCLAFAMAAWKFTRTKQTWNLMLVKTECEGKRYDVESYCFFFISESARFNWTPFENVLPSGIISQISRFCFLFRYMLSSVQRSYCSTKRLCALLLPIKVTCHGFWVSQPCSARISSKSSRRT